MYYVFPQKQPILTYKREC